MGNATPASSPRHNTGDRDPLPPPRKRMRVNPDTSRTKSGLPTELWQNEVLPYLDVKGKAQLRGVSRAHKYVVPLKEVCTPGFCLRRTYWQHTDDDHPCTKPCREMVDAFAPTLLDLLLTLFDALKAHPSVTGVAVLESYDPGVQLVYDFEGNGRPPALNGYWDWYWDKIYDPEDDEEPGSFRNENKAWSTEDKKRWLHNYPDHVARFLRALTTRDHILYGRGYGINRDRYEERQKRQQAERESQQEGIATLQLRLDLSAPSREFKTNFAIAPLQRIITAKWPTCTSTVRVSETEDQGSFEFNCTIVWECA